MPGGFARGALDSVGDLPDNVLDAMKGVGGFDDSVEYGGLPEVDDRFIEVSHDSEHVTHEGLIDMAHKDGLALTFTEPVQLPSAKHLEGRTDNPEPVVFRAVVVTRRGVFTAYGDATQKDTMVDAVIRMAETRALSRALRQAVNIGSATAPEMPDSSSGVVVDD